MVCFIKGKKKVKEEYFIDIKSMVVGAKDDAGNKIVNVFAKYDNYIIYEIDSQSYQSRIRTVISSRNDELGEKYQERFNRVKDAFIKAKEMLNHTDHYDENKHMIAHILSTYLFSDIEEDVKGSKFYKLIDDIKRKNRDYLINKILLILPSFLLVLLLACIHHNIYALYIIAILIGNIISISFFYNSAKLQEFNHCAYYILAGIVKILLSIVVGTFVFILLKSEILSFSFINDENWGMLLLFVFVGFSERFVLKLLSKTEKTFLDN